MGMFDYQPDKQDINVPLFERLGQQSDASQMAFAREHVDPFLEKNLGYVSPEGKLRKIASNTDLSNSDDVQNTWKLLSAKNPKAGMAWLKSVKPIIELNIQKQNAESAARTAANKANPINAEEQKVYKNVQDLYSQTFCKGGMIGKECAVPISNARLQAKYTTEVDGKRVTTLPTPEEFAAEFGQNAYDIYRRRTGQGTPTRQANPDAVAPSLPDGAPESVAVKFNLSEEEEAAWGKNIREAQLLGKSDAVIKNVINKLRKAAPIPTVELQDISSEESSVGVPFSAPQNADQVVYDKFGGLNL